MDWLNSVVEIAQVAERVLPLFLLAEDEEKEPWMCGPVAWSTEGSEVHATNMGGDEVSLLYSKATPNAVVTNLQPLRKGKGYDASSNLEDFKDGSVTIAPVTATQVDGVPCRQITGTFKWVAMGAVVTVLKGVSFSYKKTDDGFIATVETTGPKISEVELRATDPNGNSTQARGKFGDGIAEDTVEIVIPEGAELDPQAAEFEVAIDLDEADYEAAVSRRRELELSAA